MVTARVAKLSQLVTDVLPSTTLGGIGGETVLKHVVGLLRDPRKREGVWRMRARSEEAQPLCGGEGTRERTGKKKEQVRLRGLSDGARGIGGWRE